MTAPRLLRKPSLSINRPTIFLIHRTVVSSIPRRRTFSQCHYRPQQHSERELQERLQAARPLVPHRAARKFTQAGSSRNSRLTVIATVLAAIGFYFYNSQTVPVTGRRRFNFLSDSMVARAHSKAATQVIEQVRAQGGHFLSEWDPRTILVRRVMKKLIPVSGMADLNWEIFVIADNRTANAFVLPGGKVFVHSGIINVCRSEDALAAVLGHEIAHNTASHAAERLSAAWVGNLTAGSLFFLAGALPGLALFGLWNVVGGYYLQDLLFYLPMGRKQESEADYIGLMMMAEACYDPRAALGFWQRMHALQHASGEEAPEMLSTHPSNENRIVKISEWLPKALEKRAESDCRGTAAFADRFRDAIRRRSTTVVV
ncbi:OMA1-metalloendopeptidase of the mitochondrial inner membrane [Fusarium fujikuroi]|nr:OMA1-metalloendopeptidase of the mitochondrial inner membrane [Fusarium fujikuroi]